MERFSFYKGGHMSTALRVDVDVEKGLAALYQGVTVAIERIGRERASAYMKFNTRNRPLNKLHAEQFRDAMSDGDWWMNGETIIFSICGALLNGQHRLWAIMSSGVEVDLMVVRGIDPDAFRTIDGVRSRRASDILAMDGEKNATGVAAAVQALLGFVNDQGRIHSGGFRAGRKATAAVCDRVLETHPGLRESVAMMKRNTLFRGQQAALLHYLFGLVDPLRADEFAKVLDGGDSDIGRPFVLFREALVRNPMRSELRAAHSARAVKAFNAECAGIRPKMLKFISGETFPEIEGLDYEALFASVG